jgi:hypothetical protein
MFRSLRWSAFRNRCTRVDWQVLNRKREVTFSDNKRMEIVRTENWEPWGIIHKSHRSVMKERMENNCPPSRQPSYRAYTPRWMGQLVINIERLNSALSYSLHARGYDSYDMYFQCHTNSQKVAKANDEPTITFSSQALFFHRLCEHAKTEDISYRNKYRSCTHESLRLRETWVSLSQPTETQTSVKRFCRRIQRSRNTMSHRCSRRD